METTIAPAVNINKEQQLYVIPCGKGYSCLGFEVLEGRIARLSQELVALDLMDEAHKINRAPAKVGTPERHAQYSELIDIASKAHQRCNIKFLAELSPQLKGLVGERVEVIDQAGEKRRFTVGVSTGFIPCHLEVATSRSTGGGACDRLYKSVRVIS